MKVKVRVSQTLHKYVTVEVDNYYDAWQEAREMCEPYITDADDYDDFDFDDYEVIEE